MIRWTILSSKIRNFYYTSDASKVCNSVAPLIISESLKYKKVYGIFKPLMDSCYISGIVCRFHNLICSTVGKILNVRGHYLEVWCLPSVTYGSWLYQSQNIVQSIGVFVGILYISLYRVSRYLPNPDLFNNSKTNEDIAARFEQEYVRCVRNEEECVCSVCLFRCNIFISFRIIKEMPGLVGSGIPYITLPLFVLSTVQTQEQRWLPYFQLCKWN